MPIVQVGNPNNIRFVYIYKDREYTWDIYPPETDHEPIFEKMIESLVRPISKAVVYKGDIILKEIDFNITAIRGT